ncbi:hypothetical protein BKA70DRAFT_1216369 [Coprinopsis sp. MPI-PUGE-AT-0042]|nr:hypothetical protein BKA70DRAFT_1216369 [Coprinopsis sp. MPI-PUGE-AT-0042]
MFLANDARYSTSEFICDARSRYTNASNTLSRQRRRCLERAIAIFGRSSVLWRLAGTCFLVKGPDMLSNSVDGSPKSTQSVIQTLDTSAMLRVIKPRNARSKRALEAREPKEVEEPRTAIFVKGTHTGEVLNHVFKDLMALKRPNTIAFNKKNTIHPFEALSSTSSSSDASLFNTIPSLSANSTNSTGNSTNIFSGPSTPSSTSSTSLQSLEFWSTKNDASMFVVGQTTKKRPHGMTFVRMFDHRVLDMVELGVDNVLVDFFNGEVIDAIHLAGLEWVISVSLAPVPADSSNSASLLPKVHLRTYTIKMLASGVRTPRVELVPMGPSLDMSLRRHTAPSQDLWNQAMKRPKLAKKDIESGLGKKRKNLETDDMGDLRGRIHIGKQDLNKMRGTRMKGLKGGMAELGSDERSSKKARLAEDEED